MRWALILLIACGADHYGAYFHVNAQTSFDQLEFFFGGAFPSRRCMNQASQFVRAPELTAGWSRNSTAAGPNMDLMFRREIVAQDVEMMPAATKSFTYYVSTIDQDPDLGFPSMF